MGNDFRDEDAGGVDEVVLVVCAVVGVADFERFGAFNGRKGGGAQGDGCGVRSGDGVVDDVARSGNDGVNALSGIFIPDIAGEFAEILVEFVGSGGEPAGVGIDGDSLVV